MSFLAIDAQKSLFTLQRNQLQFEQTLIINQANWLTKEMSYYADEMQNTNEEWDMDQDSYYLDLQAQSEYLESRKDSLDSQINLMNESISSLKTLTNNNIKSSCALNLIGG